MYPEQHGVAHPCSQQAGKNLCTHIEKNLEKGGVYLMCFRSGSPPCPPPVILLIYNAGFSKKKGGEEITGSKKGKRGQRMVEDSPGQGVHVGWI